MDPYTRLAEFIHDRLTAPFVWGTNDCCLFAADWAVAAGKGDPMEDFRGTYSTAKEAIAKWRDVGGYEVEGGKRLEALGCPEVENPQAFARRGDIALIQSSAHHSAFGIVEGGGVWALMPEGAQRVPLSVILKAWRVL